MSTLKELLTQEEIEKCFGKHEGFLTFYDLKSQSVDNLYKICVKILPLVYPNGITENKSIISVGWEFITKRAILKDIRIFD